MIKFFLAVYVLFTEAQAAKVGGQLAASEILKSRPDCFSKGAVGIKVKRLLVAAHRCTQNN